MYVLQQCSTTKDPWYNNPPLLDVPQVVELSSLVVEAVGDLVPDYDTDAAVVKGLRKVLVIEWWLKDSGWEHWKGSRCQTVFLPIEFNQDVGN